jgi:hypothetical protein
MHPSLIHLLLMAHTSAHQLVSTSWFDSGAPFLIGVAVLIVLIVSSAFSRRQRD